ncbi:MAG TPA: hypothetical protein DCX10_02085, partial [Verrucomicrobiales bacterium]|nr:hypothetical protein [Verrucomicrobiales bacterium]
IILKQQKIAVKRGLSYCKVKLSVYWCGKYALNQVFSQSLRLGDHFRLMRLPVCQFKVHLRDSF